MPAPGPPPGHPGTGAGPARLPELAGAPYDASNPDRAGAWSLYLTEATANPVVVTFGRARRQVIQSKGYWNDPRGRPIQVRLAGFFRQAPEPVLAALAKWLKQGRRAKGAARVLDDFIELGLAATPRPARKAPATETSGQAHDLAELTDELFAPGGALELGALEPLGLPLITWGRRGPSRARRSLQLGSYEEDRHLIRIHRVLDQPAVPRSFVRFVLFHELLHATRAAEASGSTDTTTRRRRLHHDAEFRKREATYPGFAKALAWQQHHIAALLRSARSERPLTVSRPRQLLDAALRQLRLEF